MKKTALATLLALTALTGCGDESGSVSLGMFTTKDIKIDHIVDPTVTGVTCHFSEIVDNLSFSDPSNMSISCRQTGEITKDMLAQIKKGKGGEQVFKTSKSVFLKSMKIRRIYDEKTQSLLYVSYSTKELNGSHHHSLSTVPLWGTGAYIAKENVAE